MKTFLIAAAIGTLAMTTSAFASDGAPPYYDYGTVTKIGKTTIQLGDGTTYDVLDVKDLRSVRVGEKVDLWLAPNGEVTSIIRG